MPTMRNRRDVWLINTVPYKGGHFAAFPPKLAETCICLLYTSACAFLAAFLLAFLVRAPSIRSKTRSAAAVSMKSIYELYDKWCSDNGFGIENKGNFIAELKPPTGTP